MDAPVMFGFQKDKIKRAAIFLIPHAALLLFIILFNYYEKNLIKMIKKLFVNFF